MAAQKFEPVDCSGCNRLEGHSRCKNIKSRGLCLKDKRAKARDQVLVIASMCSSLSEGNSNLQLQV